MLSREVMVWNAGMLLCIYLERLLLRTLGGGGISPQLTA